METARANGVESTELALGGLAVRKQITILIGAHEELRVHLLLYLPAAPHKPAGVFVRLNFNGNQTVDADPGITLSPVWLRDPALADVPIAKELSGHERAMASESTRGSAASQWQLRMILDHGYGLATEYAGDFEPDFSTGIGYEVRPLFFGPDQRTPHANDWGATGPGPGA